MQITTFGTYPVTIGSLIAFVVLVLAILGLVGVMPLSATVVFGLLAALSIARLT